MSEPGEEPLLLDPSVFLGAKGFRWLLEVPPDQRTRFVVPRTFFDQVAGRADYTATDEELWGKLPQGHARSELEELLAGLTMFSLSTMFSLPGLPMGSAGFESLALGVDVSPTYLPPEVADVAARLPTWDHKSRLKSGLYLHTHSRLGARTRKVFKHFKRAGAKAVEVGGNLVEDLVWLALGKKPIEQQPGTLTLELARKAGINVVIVGGIAALGQIWPVVAVPGVVVMFIIQPLLAHRPPR